MYQYVRALAYYQDPQVVNYSAYWIGMMYFLLLVIVGNFILLSLFTAILLQNFDDGASKDLQKEHDEKLAELKAAEEAMDNPLSL